ncbi:MAG: helix-turn-helix domain-containing protein, partial [Candidatus Thermoplasmatota archaeon]|nr:helix-turn-helix domain-containing protein [Candidatus Thermoplasmatota archaeon]
MELEHEALMTLGLTDYQARAYGALVGMGTATASEIAEAGNIPRSKVYSVLDDLVRDTWASVEAGRPKVYRPARPRDRVEQAREEVNDLVDGGLAQLEAKYHAEGTIYSGPLFVLRGDEALAERMDELLREARESVLLLLPFLVPGADGELADALSRAHERGVRVRVVVPGPGT